MSAPRVEYQVLDGAALTNEVLGQLHHLGYAADARLIVFVRHVPVDEAEAERREAGEETESA